MDGYGGRDASPHPLYWYPCYYRPVYWYPCYYRPAGWPTAHSPHASQPYWVGDQPTNYPTYAHSSDTQYGRAKPLEYTVANEAKAETTRSVTRTLVETGVKAAIVLTLAAVGLPWSG